MKQKHIMHCLKLDENHTNALMAKALCYEWMDDCASAIACYETLIEDEGESDEDIALLTNQFLESDFAEGVSSENYIEKFLEFALSDENGDGLNPETGLEIASAEVDGTVDETNTVITDSDGVDPSLGDETDTLGLTGTDDSGDGIDSIALTEIDDTGSSEVLAGTNGTVSREGLDDIRSGIFGTSENG